MSSEQMSAAAKRIRDIYSIKPCMPFIQREFGFYSIDRWIKEEGFPANVNPYRYFGFEHDGKFDVWNLGWCEAAFSPSFEEKILEDRGDYELVQDYAGRGVLCFKGRRSGFMPEYLSHPVKDEKTWERNVLWRLNPATQSRYVKDTSAIKPLLDAAARGEMICQRVIGGYMYLRSLIGPTELLYMTCENPSLIHACMEAWFKLADAVTADIQKYVSIDELFFAEDICYNNGLLISPVMIREFLFPYYTSLIGNIRTRNLDKNRKLHIQIDTDGNCLPAIPLYSEIGMTAMSPFEVASGCDVVEIGRNYPDLVMSGGVDKRVLAESKEAIDKFVDRIFPPMFERGGYIPTCDHGVPEEVSLDNYNHFRMRCREFGIQGSYCTAQSNLSQK